MPTKHGSLAANPPNMTFGSVQVGTSQTQTETITNSGGQSLTIYQSTTTGTGFNVNGLSTPLLLTTGQSYTFSITFAPQSSGSTIGAVTLSSRTGRSSQAISLSGTGTSAGQLSLSPATLSFGSVTVGSSESLTQTVMATGASVTISSAASGSPEFVLNGATFPLTLTAGQSASLSVVFTPQSSGSTSTSISLVSNAANSPLLGTATGTGTAPPHHSVALTWIPSTSVVVGYNVYRGATSGGPYAKINSVLDSSTAYTDTNVLAGQTYYYAATAVDPGGTESAYSNQVQAIIPTP
jgi:hypothetical protein